MAYLFLAFAIVGELIGTSMLKASEGFTKWLPTLGMLFSFIFSFFFLSLSLKTIPLNIAYALWSGLGIIATVIISIFIWKEKINGASVIGISLILIGVTILNLFGPAHNDAKNAEHSIENESTSNDE